MSLNEALRCFIKQVIQINLDEADLAEIIITKKIT